MSSSYPETMADGKQVNSHHEAHYALYKVGGGVVSRETSPPPALYKVCISGVLSFVGVFTCCLTLFPDKKSSQRSGACVKTVGIRVFAGPTAVYIAEQGSGTRTNNTNSELKVIVSLRFLFGY